MHTTLRYALLAVNVYNSGSFLCGVWFPSKMYYTKWR